MEYFLDLLPFSNMSRLELGFWSFPHLAVPDSHPSTYWTCYAAMRLWWLVFCYEWQPYTTVGKTKVGNLLNLFQLFVDYHSNVLADGAVCDVCPGCRLHFSKPQRAFWDTRKGGVAMAAVGACGRFRSNLRLIFSYRGYYEPCGITRAETLWVFGWFFQCDLWLLVALWVF